MKYGTGKEHMSTVLIKTYPLNRRSRKIYSKNSLMQFKVNGWLKGSQKLSALIYQEVAWYFTFYAITQGRS